MNHDPGDTHTYSHFYIENILLNNQKNFTYNPKKEHDNQIFVRIDNEQHSSVKLPQSTHFEPK